MLNWGGTVVQTLLPRHLSDSSTSYRHGKMSQIPAEKIQKLLTEILKILKLIRKAIMAVSLKIKYEE